MNRNSRHKLKKNKGTIDKHTHTTELEWPILWAEPYVFYIFKKLFKMVQSKLANLDRARHRCNGVTRTQNIESISFLVLGS